MTSSNSGVDGGESASRENGCDGSSGGVIGSGMTEFSRRDDDLFFASEKRSHSSFDRSMSTISTTYGSFEASTMNGKKDWKNLSNGIVAGACDSDVSYRDDFGQYNSSDEIDSTLLGGSPFCDGNRRKRKDSFERLTHLFSAADKYDIPTLKKRCAKQLLRRMNGETVLDVLAMAIAAPDLPFMMKKGEYLLSKIGD